MSGYTADAIVCHHNNANAIQQQIQAQHLLQ